jgi:Ca2+/H+ antiporter
MTLLHLPIDLLLLNFVGMCLCLGIIVSCICRLNVSRTMNWRMLLVQMMLVSFAAFTAGTFVELLRGQVLSMHQALGVLGILLYVVVTLQEWRAHEEPEHRQCVGSRWDALERNYVPVYADDEGSRSAHSAVH